jgi:hypothetical protein
VRIVGVYSFNHAKEVVTQQHPLELEEVLQVIEAVDAEQHKVETGKRKTRKGRILYAPQALKYAFGPCPHTGNHLRALKCETIQELFGKLSGCLTPNTGMISLGVVIGNRPAHQLT